MNETHIDIEELSAYVDGEAAQPERVARHLRHCADCAKKQIQLLKLSAHVGALPNPPENPEVLGRVLDEVGRIHANEKPVHSRIVPFRAARRWALPAAAAAALMISVYGGDWALQHRQTAIPQSAVPVPSTTPVLLPVVAPVQSTARADEDTSANGANYDGLIHLLADTAGMDDYVPVSDDPDVYAMIDGLEPGESMEFQDLLNNYANEG